ncbi:ATPase, T2SS/T4P/T4SS family [Brevibacillus sp. 179-C9.2 HS]|uniref:ATPase, T2SS/T4P/T4SS family n=2 Tax=Brevibacillus TaxID=55080 RepID=UPI0039A0E10A
MMNQKFYVGHFKGIDLGNNIDNRKIVKSEFKEFEEIALAYDRHFDAEFEKSKQKEQQELLERCHKAIIGVPEHVTLVMESIQSYLNENNIKYADLPEYYEGLIPFAAEEQQRFSELTHALYHELFGFGPLAHWNKYPDSYSAQVIGRNIYMFINGKNQKMPFSFKSDKTVQRIIDRLDYHNEGNRINRYNPYAEVDLYTGERVTAIIPPRVKNVTITFRRFLINHVTLADLAARRMFDGEALPIFRGISKTHCNKVVGGAPTTGKSTFLKAMFAERSSHLTAAIIEKHYELAMSRDFPDHPVVEFIVDESKFHHVFDLVLRSDIDYAIIGEIRRVEVEGAMLACERLKKGFMGTYHTEDAEEIPSQWANLNLDLFPGRRYESELARVASKLDLVIDLRQNEEKTHKWVNSIQEIRYNKYTGEVSSHYWMWRNPISENYEYHFDISNKLIEEMMRQNREATNMLLTTLEQLSQKSPLSIEPVKYFNPVHEQPLYKIAGYLEQMRELLTEGVKN